MPDLSVGLAEYRQRILALASECKARGKTCLFLTQPTMWRADLPAELEALMWFGWIGPRDTPKGFASMGDLARAMKQYNDVLMQACKDGGADCLDLAAAIPKDTSAMFDDCHFNINGARLVAAEIARFLRTSAPERPKG